MTSISRRTLHRSLGLVQHRKSAPLRSATLPKCRFVAFFSNACPSPEHEYCHYYPQSIPPAPTPALQIRVSCSGCQETNFHLDSYPPDSGDNASSASGMSLPSSLTPFSTQHIPRTPAAGTSRPRRCAYDTSTAFPTNYCQCPPTSHCPAHTTSPTLSITGLTSTATFAALYLLWRGHGLSPLVPDTTHSALFTFNSVLLHPSSHEASMLYP